MRGGVESPGRDVRPGDDFWKLTNVARLRAVDIRIWV